MKPIQLRFEKSFFIRWSLISGLAILMMMVPMLIMKGGGLLKLFLLIVALLPLLFPVREWRMAARLIDDEGVTRHDGKRMLWADLKRIQQVNTVSSHGQTGAMNHLDIHFTTGHARILPMELQNGYEAIRVIQQKYAKPDQATATVSSAPAPLPEKCPLCGDLGDYHRAMQKYGCEEADSALPAAANNLKFVKDLRPGATRSPTLLRCPGCGSYFRYKVSYEYLATGSEDEQELSRLTPTEAEELIAGK